MQINSTPNYNNPSFNRLVPGNLPERFALVDKLSTNRKLYRHYQRVFAEQSSNPIDIVVQMDAATRKLFFQVKDKIFKSNFFTPERIALQQAADEANLLRMNSFKFIEIN